MPNDTHSGDRRPTDERGDGTRTSRRAAAPRTAVTPDEPRPGDPRPTRPTDSRTPQDNPRPSVTHDRQSHIVNPPAADEARRDDADVDPTMPTGDSSLRTEI